MHDERYNACCCRRRLFGGLRWNSTGMLCQQEYTHRNSWQTSVLYGSSQKSNVEWIVGKGLGDTLSCDVTRRLSSSPFPGVSNTDTLRGARAYLEKVADHACSMQRNSMIWVRLSSTFQTDKALTAVFIVPCFVKVQVELSQLVPVPLISYLFGNF